MLISLMNVQELFEEVAGYQPIAPATRKGWTYGIRGIEDIDIETIDKSFVNRRRSYLNRQGYKPGYVRSLLGYCGTIWQIAMEQMELVDSNPWRGSLKGLKKQKKNYPFLPYEHYVNCGLGNDPMFNALWLHGFRVNEIVGISPEEIVRDADIPHFDLKHNRVRGLKNEKSIRQVPMHPLFLERGHYDQFMKDYSLYGYWKRNPKHGDNYSRHLKKICGHSAHGLRHNIVTRMRKAGIEYSIAASILGHDAEGMTSNYGEIQLDDKYEQLKKLK